MPVRATRPFFARFGLASLVNLVMAAALAAIGLLDVLTLPHSTWKAGEPAPTSYRISGGKRCAFDSLLGNVGQALEDERFLVRKGQTVTHELIEDLRQQLPERGRIDPVRALGALVFYLLALTFFRFFLLRAGQHMLLRLRTVASLYLVLLVCTLSSKLMFDQTTLSLYAAPTSLAVLLFAPLVSQTIAFALHLLAVALLAPMMGFAPGMVLLPLVTGWAAVLVLRPGASAGRVLLASLLGALLGAVSMFGLDLFAPHRFDYGLHPEGDLTGLLAGTIGAGLLAILLGPLVALAFGAVTRARLAGLLNMDHPVLRDLAEKAPGTFQHTLAVANMAEKVADDIGGDAALTRVGAYFHDIGKMKDPEYFSENQKGDNPHERLTPDASAERLRGHIAHGMTIARGANLPQRVVEFIVEHHGSSVMEFFLDKASRAEGRAVDPGRFSYQGLNPTSRETAVLMLVDSVEAASHTLQHPDREKIEDLVRRIIFGKLLKGYLDDSGLTSKDLKRIGLSLMRILESQFHVRVEYPWQRRDTPPPAPVAEPPRRPLTDPSMRVVQPVPPGAPEVTPAPTAEPAPHPAAEPGAGLGVPPAAPTPGSSNDHDR